MRSLRLFGRFALSTAASALLLAGCGVRQAQDDMPAVDAPLGSSWMLVQASGEDLLYAAARREIEIYSYPDGRRVGALSTYSYPRGLCSDPNGDVFVDAGGTILEYAHGATKPIAKIKSKFGSPLQCAYDPTTGNLAVLDTYFTGPDNVAIYKNATGKATEYLDEKAFYSLTGCTYDGSGNLFITGFTGAIGELPAGGSAFVNYNPRLKSDSSTLGQIQWDGQYLVVQEKPAAQGHALLDRITIANKKAKVVSRTRLSGNDIGFRWLYDGAAIGFVGERNHTISSWPYPAGGLGSVLVRSDRGFYALTISVAASKR